MMEHTGVDAGPAGAGRLLAEVAEEAEYARDPADKARAVREAYTAVQRVDPASLEAAVGLAVLGGAELRGHMVNRVDTGWWEEDSKPIARIPPERRRPRSRG
ncbi:hypothetical protein [Nonomuraea roseola]|uniref:Uncharacterized protein n=1 Tax=Nonomuraea roseola TaxID=46179 RepID=A0ABV5PRQ6_9ACTN